MGLEMVASIATPLGLLGLGLAVVGSVTDVKSRVIPNWLTVGAFGLALLVRAVGPEPVLSGLAGAAFLFGVGLVLYVARIVGAGDVKYLAAFGAILGAGRIWPALLLVTLAAGALAILWSILMGRGSELRGSFLQLVIYCGTLGFFGSRRILSDAAAEVALAPIPLGVAIAVGCTLVWFI